MTNERGLRALSRGQHGAFLTGQAQRSGVPDHVLRGWISSGLLDRFGVRTLRSATSASTPADDAAAHLLDITPPAWLSHRSAASVLGLDTFGRLDAPFHVTLRRGTYTRRSGVIVHTTDDLPTTDVVIIDGIAMTNAVRTVIDLARTESPRRLTAIVDGGLRDRMFTEERLLTRVAELRSQGRYGIPRLLSAIESCEPARGGESWLERRYLELAANAGLPHPDTQRHLGRVDGRLVRVDCYYPDADLVVELLGYRWHRSTAQMNRDSLRINKLQMDGRMVLQFTYEQVTLAPRVVLGTVVEARAKRLRQLSA